MAQTNGLSYPVAFGNIKRKMPKERETPSCDLLFMLSFLSPGHAVNSAETKGTDCVGVVTKLAAFSEKGAGKRSCLGEFLGIISRSGVPQHG